MTDAPFSRPFSAQDAPPGGSTLTLAAEPAERSALAEMLDLPEVKRLEAVLTVKPWGRDGLAVTGEVTADVVQICGVTLEPFDTQVREEVDVRFVAEAPEVPEETPGGEHEADLDAPDVLVNGVADLGALAAEHLALGLDPYPRKPGLDEAPAAESQELGTYRPFAGLGELLNRPSGGKK